MFTEASKDTAATVTTAQIMVLLNRFHLSCDEIRCDEIRGQTELTPTLMGTKQIGSLPSVPDFSGSLALVAQEREQQALCSAVRIAGYSVHWTI